MKKIQLIIITILTINFSGRSQILSVDELIRFPHQDADSIKTQLVAKGWEASNIEFVADSHFVRRTWRVKNAYDDLKSYLILYEYTSDPAENHIIYQFSNRESFKKYKDDLKTMGYTLLAEKKGKKK